MNTNSIANKKRCSSEVWFGKEGETGEKSENKRKIKSILKDKNIDVIKQKWYHVFKFLFVRRRIIS